MKKYLKETFKYLLRSKWIINPYIKEVERMYAMSPEQLRTRNERRFLEIFRKAYDKSSFYHKLYTDAGIDKGDIQCLEDIKKLPVVTKDMVKTHGQEMLTEPKWKLLSNHTSGTTGTPLTVYESWPSLWREQAYLYCYRKRCGYTYGQPLVSLRGNLEKKDLYLKVHVSNTLYLSSYNINAANAQLYYDKIVEHKPQAIEGYPSSLYALALMLRDKNLQLHIPVAFTSSETLLDYQRTVIEKQFNTQIFDHFGTTERTIFLSESINHTGYYEAPGYSINEYNAEGSFTTSLINEAFPLIRYKGNDIFEIDTNPDGEPLSIVQSIQGRSEDYIEGKDGTAIKRLDFVFKGVKHVKISQLVQREAGKIEILVVPEGDFEESDTQQILKNFEDRVGEGNMDVSLKLVTINELNYTKSGKFKYIINLKNILGGGIIRSIRGRISTCLVGKDGSLYSGALMTRVFKDITTIDNAQFVQDQRGVATLNYVPNKDFSSHNLEQLRSAVIEQLGRDNFDVTFAAVTDDALIYSNRGKFSYIVNRIGFSS